MNKDFLKKPISLKDIDIRNIDIKKLKNKKEIIIGILSIIYIVFICIFGNNLLKTRSEVKAQFDIKEQRYQSLQRVQSEEEIKKQIEGIELEKEKIESRVVSAGTNAELTQIFNEFRINAPISWVEKDQNINIRQETNEFKDYNVYSISVSSFSGTLEQIEQFLEYVDNYNKIIRVDSLSFRQNPITGRLSGEVRLSFYFKK